MDTFWSPAEPRIQIWRTVLGLVLVFVAFFASTFGFISLGGAILGMGPNSLMASGTPEASTFFFATFLGFHVGLIIVLWVLHKRGYVTLFGPARRLNWHHFLLGMLATFALAALLYGLMFVERLFLADEIAPKIRQIRPASEWLLWVIPAVVLIFVQILAEEAVFRGYLLQQLRARFTSVFIWAVLPSLAFGLLHFDAGTYGALNGAAYVINTTTTGILLCLITLRTGNLGAAAGLHFGNNAALILVGIDGTLDGFSLFVVGMELQSGYTAYSILMQTVITLIVFGLWWRWLNRRDKIANAASRA